MEATKHPPCRNCSEQFTFFGSVSPLKGRIPYSLQCGHPICEKCIFSTIRTAKEVECVQCKTVTNLPDSDIKKIRENPLSFQIFFPPHFHLLGQMVYDYSVENSVQVKSFGKNMHYIPAGSILQIQEHRNKYKHQRNVELQENRKKNDKILDYKRYLKSLSLCQAHPDKILELYCSDCCKAVCAICLVNTCSKHSFTIATEKKEDFIVEINKNKLIVRDVLLRLKKTVSELEKKRLVNLFGSLDCQPNDVVIAEHFLRAHGVLQRAEYELLTQLQHSKNHFNNMLDSLHDTVHQLTELSEYVDMSLLPENMNTANFFEIAKALELATNTPWYYDGTNSAKLKIRLNVDENALTSLKDFCQIDVDGVNEWKLLSTSELPSYIELPPVPPEVNIETSSVKSNGSSYTTRRSGSPPPSSGFPGYHKNLSFDLKSKNKSVPKVNQVLPQRVDQPVIQKENRPFRPLVSGVVERVVVTHINSPHDFYVQRRVMLPTMAEMSETYHGIKNSLVEPDADNIAPGIIYLVYDSEQKRWDRVNMVQQNPDRKEGEYTVQYMDFGNIADVNIKRLRIAPTEPYFPIFALSCTLVGCEPITKKWRDEDNLAMVKMMKISQSECQMNVIRISKNLLEVDLIMCPSDPHEHPTSLTEALIFLGNACLGDPKNQVNRQNNPLYLLKQYFTKQKLSDVELVTVTHVVDPGQFYVKKNDLNQYIRNLCNSLNDTYKLSNLQGTIFAPKEGMCVACCVNNKWWRARITGLKAERQLEVFLVDAGEKHIVDFSCIRKLHMKFVKIDELVSRCKLANTQPTGQTWSAEATEFMKTFVKNNATCILRMFNTHQKKYRKKDVEPVHLFKKTEEGEEISLNNELVKRGFALSPPNSKQVNVKSQDSGVTSNTAAAGSVLGAREEVMTPGAETSSEGGRLEVKVLCVISPSEIYVSTKCDSEYDDLYNEIDKFYADSKYDWSLVWNKGDKCAVMAEGGRKWNRGIIEDINQETNKYKVFLKDHGKSCETTDEFLRPLEEKFLNVRDGAYKCYLSGITPASGEKWPMLTCETLQEIVGQYERLYITKDGEITNKSLPVKLWVFHTIQGGALTPTVKRWETVNDRIVERGLAIPIRVSILKRAEPAQSSASVTTNADTAMLDQQLNMNASSQSKVQQVCDEVASLSMHDDWLPAAPLKSTTFVAIPTNVDNDLTIFLHDIQNVSTLELLSNILTSHFKNSKPKPYDLFWYPGQICITKFVIDEKYYRAKVLEILENNEVLVMFVDYGNLQKCSITMLRKDVVCHHIPIQTHKCKVYDIKPIGHDTWEQNIGDFVHQNLVEKECLVDVKGPAVDGIIPISLKINKEFDLSELLLSLKYAQPADITESLSAARPATEDDPDVIEDEPSKELPRVP